MEHKSEVLSCKFTPDGTCIAASAIDGTIKVWDTRLGKLIQHYNAHDRPVNRIAFHPLGYHMASVSSDNKIKIWELKQGRLGWTVFGHEGEIRAIDFNEKGDYFATGGDDKMVMIWMSNFDRELNNTGRGVDENFKEKANGDGVQPLFKSNKLGLDIPVANEPISSNVNATNVSNDNGKTKPEARS
jgi:centriolar protein POC1